MIESEIPDFQIACVLPHATIRQAMQAINDSGLEIAFLVEEVSRRLLGTVSDGDVRRGLLAGAQMDDAVLQFANLNCASVSQLAGRSEVLDELRARGFSQMPIVDQNGCLTGVHLLREILGSFKRPNWAVIMAGGRGERLRPVTDSIPKPMIKVAGRPILERLVLHYVGFGIRTIYLSVNYLSHFIRDHFDTGSRFGCEIRYLEEKQPLGTAGALSLLPAQPQSPILVTNGDLITEFDVGAILSFHAVRNHALTVGVSEYRHTVPFGVLEMEQEQVLSLREKPAMSCLVNTGVYVLEPHLLSRIPRDKEYTMPELINDCLHRKEKVGGHSIHGSWTDIGRPADLYAASGAV